MIDKRLNRRDFLKRSGTVTGALTAAQVGVVSSMWTAHAQAAQATPDAIHFLNRTTYGVSARDVADIATRGIEGYLENQLSLDATDDAVVERTTRAIYPRAFLEGPSYWPLLFRGLEDISAIREDAIGNLLFRALHTKRQLHEIMVGFWTDHFNIYDLAYRVEEQNKVIRPNALTSFRSLLLASAHDTAMLIYLHNRDSIKGVPNEDYSRELMELHTLGEGNGYTQDDVIEVARALTGWGHNDAGAFQFDMSKHDTGPKRVLGVDLPPGRGIQDGNDVLEILLARDETAHFIAEKLCKRFVADHPPAAVVAAAEAAFKSSGGDIASMLRVIFRSPEFYQSKGQKLQRPLESLVGVYRRWDIHISEGIPQGLIQGLAEAGHTPHSRPTPDGFPANNGYWANSNALLSCWNNFSNTTLEDVAQDTLFKNIGGQTRAEKLVYGPSTLGHLVDHIADRILHAPLDNGIRGAIIDWAGEAESTALTREAAEGLAGGISTLILCSPQHLMT